MGDLSIDNLAKNDGWFELQIESDLKNLEKVSDFIVKIMQNLGVKNEKDIFDVQLAVDEACTNIIEHAYVGQKNGKIILRCKLLSPNKFTVKLIDFGKSFDPEAVAPPDVDAKLEDRRVGGLGIFFMKHLMQTVKYDIQMKGNELTMIKLISRGLTDEY